jgi:GNAT superfamily N-acetyltransferase
MISSPTPESLAAIATTVASDVPELVRLRDGSHVTLRAVGPGDEPALYSFLAGLCEQARYLRFFTGGANLASVAHAAAADGPDRYGLLAHDEAGAVVGHAVYVQLGDKRAEFAVEVADRLHDRGLGTILIERLASVAEEHGITRFVAEVLPQNHQMLAVFRDGFDAQVALRDGCDAVEFPTSAWRMARERFSPGRRARRAPRRRARRAPRRRARHAPRRRARPASASSADESALEGVADEL